ncbi:MAG: hypothetical protein ACXAB7_16220 [Candidatus Kariarchaeaceae archaeon]|jgi:hypothetical protein
MEVLKERFQTIEPIQLGIASLIFLVGLVWSYIEFSDDALKLVLLYLLIFAGAGLGAFLWKKAIDRYFATFIFYLVEHKWVRKIVAGGSFSYYDYKDPEEETPKTKVMDPIGQIITLLFAFVGLAVFIMGFLGAEEQDNALWWGLMALLIPTLVTPLIPVTWSLDDAKVKGWSSGNNTTWMVGKNYKRRFNSVITIGAISSNLTSAEGSLGDKIGDFLGVLKVGFLVMLVSVGIFIILYYSWFREFLRIELKSALTLTTYEVVLVEKEDKEVGAEIVKAVKVEEEEEEPEEEILDEELVEEDIEPEEEIEEEETEE